MKIACLAWGSLIWNPAFNSNVKAWHEDGPYLPIEFCRAENDSGLTPVICMNALHSQVMWSALAIDSIEKASDALRECESISSTRFNGIGSMVANSLDSGSIGRWCIEKEVDAIVWIALPPKFDQVEGRIPSLDQALAYLNNITDEAREHTKKIIERAPNKISTPYRDAIANKFGWRQSA